MTLLLVFLLGIFCGICATIGFGALLNAIDHNG